MIKLEYIAGALLLIVWARGTKSESEKNQIADTVASQRGSDWIGAGGLYAMWDRLSSADLVLADYPNASGDVLPNYSKVNRREINLQPTWNGGIA